MCKKRLKSHYIVTKNKNNAFKAEAKFTKLKMKVKKKKLQILRHIYISQLQIFQQNVYEYELLCSYFIALCLVRMCAAVLVLNEV